MELKATMKRRVFNEEIKENSSIDEIQEFKNKLHAFFYFANKDISESVESDFIVEQTQQVRIDITCTIRTQEQKNDGTM
ncbi:Uncharacterised protein [Phocoenobacter uteri]|uniref:Uncharacterized protein n=1 Tax=Phocoenobacter uteri TaxID=146806 RepID=A0A379CAA6_9PAST|nr:hypothetical protein [Phocoenobacter uteri]MDG6881077.1 hypothetical protein [Phocoenobacter uteri]SUB59099.1 Uncharacterised protein [Phocoenobacter uteri]